MMLMTYFMKNFNQSMVLDTWWGELKIDPNWVFGLPKGVTTIAKKPWFFSDLLRTKILKGARPLIRGKMGKKFRETFIKTNIYLD